MDVATLKLLVDVARSKSFAAVARARGIDPSQVSRPISALEEELGIRLLQRTTRAMTLTEAGENYVAAIATLVEGLDAARDAIVAAPNDPTGTVRVTASVAFGETMLAPLLPDFRAAFPRLRMELVLTDANVDLVADRMDIALRLAPSYRADVVGVKLFPTRYRVVVSPDYIKRFGRPPTPQALASRSCVLSAVPEFRSRWLFQNANRSEQILVSGEIVSSNAVVLRAATLAGLGPALLADWLIADDLRGGALVDLFPAHEVTATTFETAAWLLYVSRQHMPAKVRVTIDFLRSHLVPQGKRRVKTTRRRVR